MELSKTVVFMLDKPTLTEIDSRVGYRERSIWIRDAIKQKLKIESLEVDVQQFADTFAEDRPISNQFLLRYRFGG